MIIPKGITYSHIQAAATLTSTFSLFFFPDVYQAYLAELQSMDKTVFSLNMERHTFLKVQFLYPDQPRQSLNKDSDMLVFLHKECNYAQKFSI